MCSEYVNNLYENKPDLRQVQWTQQELPCKKAPDTKKNQTKHSYYA